MSFLFVYPPPFGQEGSLLLRTPFFPKKHLFYSKGKKPFLFLFFYRKLFADFQVASFFQAVIINEYANHDSPFGYPRKRQKHLG